MEINKTDMCECKPFFGCVCGHEVPKKVIDIVNAFGGIHNIVGFSNSVSELRYDLKNLSIVSKDDLIKQGATNITFFYDQNHIHVEFGDVVEELNFEIKKYSQILKKQEQNTQTNTTKETKNKTEFEIEKELEVLSLTNGKVIGLKELNDGIFSEGLVGNGFAIKMDTNQKSIDLVAPFDGKITNVPANKNQFIFKSNNGVELLVLIGLDSHKLNGIGFISKVQPNTEVKSNQVIMQIELEKFVKENIDTHLIITITSDSRLKNITQLESNSILGKKLFKLT
ncbi:PTS glucose transporter subunit IIA [Mycoplasmopsis felis]|uniref:Uncharacterized protein n=1 Tax=Mycoplasmopsis felis TaxID=33923 RepID=A0A809RU26_9BACT|nr:PTS glucose transporter subunit IIA [Mycoplasmopsis felis]BBU47541.1 hypothetical protein JPM2_2340 [Mycoplasmopsis felis]